jgi:hypothetical protein
MIEGKGDRHHGMQHHLASHVNGPFFNLVEAQDTGLRRIQDRGTHQGTEHPSIGDRERASA